MTDTSIPAWLVVGAIVRCVQIKQFSPAIVKVMHVSDDGLIDARKARSNKLDLFHLPISDFAPATIEEHILFVMDANQIDEIRKVIPDGKDERQFRIIFPDRIATQIIEKMKLVFEKVVSSENPAIVVTVPPSWIAEAPAADPVTPALLAMAQAEADAVLGQATTDINPAIADKISAELVGGTVTLCDMTDAVISKGVTHSEYIVTFPTVNQIKLPAAQIKKRCQFIRVEQINHILVVTVPSFWEVKEAFAQQDAATVNESLTVEADPIEAALVENDATTAEGFMRPCETCNGAGHSVNGWGQSVICPECDGTGIYDIDQQAAIKDEDLTESARLIKELKDRNRELVRRNDALRDQVDSLIGHIDGAAQQAEAVAERDEMLISNQPLIVCKQVESIRHISDADFQKHLNEGWDALHIQFGENNILNVVFVREQPAPAPSNGNRTAARLVTPVGPTVIIGAPQPDTHGALHRKPVPTVTLNRQGTEPIRCEQIAADRIRLQALVSDPDVTDFDFSLAVEQSRLQREERNALISQYRTLRTGQRLAAQLDQMPRPSAQRPFVSLGEAQR